jgi:hypothetical protein
MTDVVRMDSVSTVYASGRSAVRALDGVTPALRRGAFAALR